jgi:hypothetical protein
MKIAMQIGPIYPGKKVPIKKRNRVNCGAACSKNACADCGSTCNCSGRVNRRTHRNRDR